MRRLVVGVPPGVGDVYWALCKLESLREREGIDELVLCPQQTSKPRAVDWQHMVSFVDEAREHPFRPDDAALIRGHSLTYLVAGDGRRGPAPEPFKLDRVLWPNAVVDRGQHLREWLPEYELDLDIDIAVDENAPRGAVVVFASSIATQRAWLPSTGPAWWASLINTLAVRFNQPVTLIGSDWDLDMRLQLASGNCRFVDLVGKTTLPQVAGILKHARAVVGLISGMTILANHFRTPCVALHADKHSAGFVHSWLKPDAPYLPIGNSVIPGTADVADCAVELAGERRYDAPTAANGTA